MESGITEKDYEIRKACLRRIKEEKIEIKGPMADQLFANLVGITDESKYNKFACEMIMDLADAVLNTENYNELNQIELFITDENGVKKNIHALTWLKNWDEHIAGIIKQVDILFEGENREYIRQKYRKYGIKGLADHFWGKFYDERINEERLSHAEPFVGTEVVADARKNSDNHFSKYNFRLFMSAQAAILAEAYFINGNLQNKNNPSDLLHLLYLDENVKYVSNDKIYRKILEACPEFNLIVLQDEKNLADLI